MDINEVILKLLERVSDIERIVRIQDSQIVYMRDELDELKDKEEAE